MNSITKKLSDNRIEKLVVTRCGQPWAAVTSPKFVNDNESLIQEKLEHIKQRRDIERDSQKEYRAYD